METSIFLLTDKLFDYAGLFPPARLNLENSLQNYLGFQSHKNKHMLGKFVFPISKTEELQKIAGQHVSLKKELNSSKFPFTVILSQPIDTLFIEKTLTDDLEKILSLSQFFPDLYITSYEICFPNQVYFNESEEKVFELLLTLNRKISSIGKDFEIFVEVPFYNTKTPLDFLKIFSEFRNQGHKHFGVKLRTGGIVADKIPSCVSLAHILLALGRQQIPFKATAGLHQPFPNFNLSVGTTMHGFLNLLLASLFVFFKDSAESSMNRIIEILSDSEESHFHTVEDGFAFKKETFSSQTISDFRGLYFKGIGSCEFLEPNDFLVQHKFLN